MGSYYPYDSGLGEAEWVVQYVLSVLMMVLVFAAVIGIVFYVFWSIGLYKIASRRCVKHAWLAWVPVANVWMLGCISDQYQYVVKERMRNRRKLLLGLGIAYAVLSMISFATTANYFVSLVKVAFEVETANPMQMLAPMMTSSLVSFLVMGVSITYAVFYYIAMYDLYVSCRPRNAVLFLVLGIIFGVTEPFFVFACRGKDEGMPPRKIVDSNLSDTYL